MCCCSGMPPKRLRKNGKPKDDMNAGIALLGLAYVLSQFFRAFLAVLVRFWSAISVPRRRPRLCLWALVPDLRGDATSHWLGAGHALARAARQPACCCWRRGGCSSFALATAPMHVAIAMALIGVGCAPVLMASYYIFARDHPPARFAFLAARHGRGRQLGNLVASYPTALAAETMGWRSALWGLGRAVRTWSRWAHWLERQGPRHAPPRANQRDRCAELLAVARALWSDLPADRESAMPLPGAVCAACGSGPIWRMWFDARHEQHRAGQPAYGAWPWSLGALAYGFADKRHVRSRKWMIAGGGTAADHGSRRWVGRIAVPGQSLILPVFSMLCAIGFFRGGLCRCSWPMGAIFCRRI